MATETNFTQELERISDIKDVVVNALSGNGQMSCLDQDPTRRYSVGILSPLPKGEQSSSSNKRRPNALGLEAIIDDTGSPTLEVTVKFAVYWRALPTFEEQLQSTQLSSEQASKQAGDRILRQKYMREDISVGPILLSVKPSETHEIESLALDSAINQKLEEVADRVVQENACWPQITENKTEIQTPLSILSSQAAYDSYINTHFSKKEKPLWTVGSVFKLWRAGEGISRLAALINNAAHEDEGRHPNALHSCSLFIKLNNSHFISAPFAASFSDYRYKTESWGKGINSVLSISEDATQASTQTTPEYHQPRTITRKEMDTACNFKDLGSDSWLKNLQQVERWLDGYAQTWHEDNKLWESKPSCKNRLADLAEFENEIERYREGIAALKRDDNLTLAFRMANQAFAAGKHPGWRLFQLVFVVTQMTSLLAREVQEDELRKALERVDVLWFPTGGGKTEAYFGVIATALFYDRMRGKSRGVTAWLRYPLRMLSIQQLQRLMDIVVSAEKIRKAASMSSLLKGDPFTLGYYVGEKNTPNNLTYGSKKPGESDKVIREWKQKVESAESMADIPLLVLQRCSFCGSDRLKIEVNVEEVRIRHICENCSEHMPIYISDSEIYRYAPSIIVGTVDRLARAGQTSHFAHIFGLFTHKCPDHGYLSGGECIERGICRRKSRDFIELQPLEDPSPALLLQDELHLLKESLGTYDSHYETFIDTFAASIGRGLPPKRLAATATIEGYKTHIKELYQRDAVRFPVKGMKEFESAYVAESVKDPLARIYVGIMPTGSGVNEVVTTILETIKASSTSTNQGDAATPSETAKELTGNYDLSLAYVNQKNTAGDLRADLDDPHEIQVLTGDKGLAEVRATIGRIESDLSQAFEDRLKILVATSVISHGVDIERLNLMCFAGFPSNASDYIQASSRVGRAHLGIVFTVFRPENNRERNLYQRFYEYHERLYQLVQPVPINRMSQPAISRTLPGVMSASILNIIGPGYAEQHEKSFDNARNFVRAFDDKYTSDEEIIELVKSSLGLAKSDLTGGSLEMIDELITTLVKEQRSQIQRNEEYSLHGRMRPQPVSSLREVGVQLGIDFRERSAWKLSQILKGRQ